MSSSVLHSAESRKSRTAGVVVTALVHIVALFMLIRMTLLSTVVIPMLSVELIVEPEPEEVRIEELRIKPLAIGKKIAEVPRVSTKTAEIDDQGDVETPVKEPIKIDERSMFRSEDVAQTADNASGESIDKRALFTGEQGLTSESFEETSVSLNGRSVVGKIGQPANTSNKEGRVVIEITVDQYGKVIQARTRIKGSTIQNTALWKAAEEAAQQTLFNTDLNSLPLQIGTITYVFKLK